MNIKQYIAEQAKTEGLFGFAFEQIENQKAWDQLTSICNELGINEPEHLDEYLQAMNYFRFCDVGEPLEVFTMFEWRKSGLGFSQACKPFTKVSEYVYWYFMEILPPVYVQNGFMVSEPYDYSIEHNASTYACFIKSGVNYIFLGDICRVQVASKIAEYESSIK